MCVFFHVRLLWLISVFERAAELLSVGPSYPVYSCAHLSLILAHFKQVSNQQ